MPGASAVPVLAPLSLAVLALGAALSIVGLVLRYVFGALTVAIAALLAWLTAQVAFAAPVVGRRLDGHRGDRHHRRGRRRRARRRRSTPTPWPFVTLAAWHRAARRGRLHPRHRAPLAGERAAVSHGCRDAGRAGDRRDSRPHDAIDSWDDLSRGEDPTA